MHHPAALVKLVVERHSVPLATLLQDTGITPSMLGSPDARVSYRQFGQLIARCLEASGDPGLGLALGKAVHIGHLGVLGPLILSCPNVRAALDATMRYNRIVTPAWNLAWEERGDALVLTFRETIPLGPLQVFATEALLMALCEQGKFLSGRPVSIRSVALAYPEPAHAERYRRLTNATFTFDAPQTEVVVDSELLDRPVVYSDPITWAMAERLVTAELSENGGRVGLLEEVRSRLSQSPARYGSIDSLARELQTSPRSLRRSLRSMGTSYQELLGQARCERAVSCLRETGMSVQELATHLGYDDVRSFRRAFKRWTGSTPAAYRAN